MSGAFAGVPNAFANAVTATGLQLDQNNNTLTAYLNDPTNRSNYAADGSSGTNTVVLTFSPPVVGGYTAGLGIAFKPAITNSGAVVVNANGLGNKNIVVPGGAALISGQLQAGDVYQAQYDGTRFVMISAPYAWQGPINTTATATINALIDISGASGGQIKFPASQNASSDANTLDDYEEGTWTPTGNSFTVVGVATHAGFYTKIGRKVHLSIKSTSTTSIASTVGASFYNALPFGVTNAGTGGAASATSGTSSSSALAYTNGNLYAPTWTAVAEEWVSVEYETTT